MLALLEQLAEKKRTIDLLLNKVEACLINVDAGSHRNSMGQDVKGLLDEELSNENIGQLFEDTGRIVIFPDTF